MFFCYLLKSINEKYLGDSYIGFTDDPIKRLRQHNGEIKGGAKKTRSKRPWNLILVISNFPNKILALKFEWAWQNPFMSKLTSELLQNYKIKEKTQIKMNLSKNKQKYYRGVVFKIDVLNFLLNSILYGKINLNISFFDEDQYNIVKDRFFSDTKLLELTDNLKFKSELQKKKKIFKYEEYMSENNTLKEFELDGMPNYDKCLICEEYFSKQSSSNRRDDCYLSSDENEEIFNFNSEFQESDDKSNDSKINRIQCPGCKGELHIICFAEILLEDTFNLIPKKANCLFCFREYKWSQFLKSN